ncbi:hypothetical protein [Exiguobacterium algae]|uniref:hypothetical protein n=1 Tax=Exiguobacterium algae TaxID=2751250 RepID=UPI001BE72524|nr:hypothetical protein [Exiguobacterium algae]
MHVSERLLQLYATLDTKTRVSIQRQITSNLADGKPLSDSFNELTGETDETISNESKTADDFTSWLKSGKTDLIFLSYYVAILERHDENHLPFFENDANASVPKHSIEDVPTHQGPFIEKEDLSSPAPIPTDEPSLQQEQTDSELLADQAVATTLLPDEEPVQPTVKPRYVAETPMPSRAERLKYQRHIEPARPRRRQSGGLMIGIFITMILLGGGYFAYPLLADLFNTSNETATTTPPVKDEPVVAVPETNDVWINVKNTSLLSAPDSTNVTYIADIGDHYPVLEEQEDYILLDLGTDDLTAWAKKSDVTTEWTGPVLSDPQLLTWIQTGVDQTYIEKSAEDYLQMTEEELYAEIGEPFGRDEDALNDYAFYSGIFFTIQNGEVMAIDWTNTGQTKDVLLQIGEPTYVTEDAVVFESDRYSLRLFIGASGTTRIRLSEI